ncbi:MAG TPA: nucleotidyltransferase domain-containing protein [Actinokineospora sp.]|jgi:predicted nucleotidyltransferase|nr:nucleotidyltransferase domain-containing protein [Actinokineospora sp.]
MHPDVELRRELARVAAEADRLRLEASTSLRNAVGKAADQGLTQQQIARAIGRSQPEVSRLLRAYRATRFHPTSALGRLLARHRDEILALALAHKAHNVRVFGSVVRGEDDEDSDIDLLVDLAPGADLLDLASLDLELERLLGHPVDVVPARMLKPHVAPSALADAVEL